MGKIKQLLRNLSIRKTFMLYVIMFLLLATALSAITINSASDIRTKIMLSYAYDTKSNEVDGSGVILNYINGEILYSAKDAIVVKLCDAVTSLSIPVFFSVCILAAALLFYRNKLKKPIEILSGASTKITENNLDFMIQYDSHDEMGNLCASFEKMRFSLEQSNREMWRQMDERKRLNAAFSHDLRTPLTVLKGQSEMLLKYVPDGKMSTEKIVATVETIRAHVARLENYVSTMNSLQRLEGIDIKKSEVAKDEIIKRLKEIGEIICADKELFFYTDELTDEFLNVDMSVVIQVYENLLSNAMRFAKSRITVKLASKKFFSLTVSDDGRGFTDKDLAEATNPFYKSDGCTDSQHFGMGLNICKILCEKHGECLVLSNQSGGATVKAVF